MRIISGKNKGRKLRAPKNLPVRPTTDMAKESLFNILNNYYYFDSIEVLDLFSGTGNISLEFASRGATKVTSVDADNGCTNFIDKMSKELNMENFHTIKDDVYKFIKKTNLKADIIFADPPYAFSQEEFEAIPNTVFKREMLNEGGMCIIEHFNKMDLSNVEHFSFSKRYGSTVFSFFEIASEEEDDDK